MNYLLLASLSLQTNAPRPPEPRSSRKLGLILVILLFLPVSFCGLLFLLNPRSFIEAYKIPSAAMEPTLQIGDHILCKELHYNFRLGANNNSPYRQLASPKRGEIVVFTLPDDPVTVKDESEINIIKRVIALGGETVEVRGTSVLINGTSLAEPYAIWKRGGLSDFGPKEVPSGKLFLLGDNRDHSRDSRFWPDPFLDSARLVSKAWLIYFNPANPSRSFTLLH